MKPTSPTTTVAASSGSSNSASTTTAAGSTGPPAKIGDRGLDEHLERRGRVLHERLARPVQDDAHRALVAVLGDQDDRAPEVGVDDDRRGDQQLAAERLHRAIVPPLRAEQNLERGSASRDASAA